MMAWEGMFDFSKYDAISYLTEEKMRVQDFLSEKLNIRHVSKGMITTNVTIKVFHNFRDQLPVFHSLRHQSPK